MSLFGSSIPVEERIMVWIHGRGETTGFDIEEGLRIGFGTLYTALIRLEKQGILASRWERDEPFKDGAPRRRLYRVTDPTP